MVQVATVNGMARTNAEPADAAGWDPDRVFDNWPLRPPGWNERELTDLRDAYHDGPAVPLGVGTPRTQVA